MISKGVRTALLMTFFTSVHAAAFDIDGFKTGMSQEATISRATKLSLSVQNQSGKSLMLTAPGRLYSLSFCGGELVQLNKHLAPTFNSFVELSEKQNRLYGPPRYVVPQLPDAESYARGHTLLLIWVNGGEVIEASHTVFPSNSQTAVTYLARNPCFGQSFFRD